MALTPGTRLGLYEIRSLLGAGGMGVVYRAHDTRLHRDVAIKVIPDLFASDPERLARFDREAQLLASLNHPHIAQIYRFEDFPPASAGEPPVRALVMELVDGPTLADRIANGPIPLHDALPIAHQIASALEAAHERGIIHRDLKPANIKLSASGAVKVLDFGLAKALDAPIGTRASASTHAAGAADCNSPAMIESPAFASPATQLGVILGTAAYMAPEQARGKAADKRTDIWAFGVVFYEMLTGERPFKGETIPDMIAAVLRQEIDWTPLPDDTPDELRRLIRRCLARDPEHRMHDAADARLVIADVQHEHPTAIVGRQSSSPSSSPSSSRSPRSSAPAVARTSTHRRMPWLVAGTVTLGLAVAGALLGRSLVARSPTAAIASNAVVRFAIEPPPEVGSISNVTVAPDGRFLVYEGQIEGESRLFLRRLDGLASRLLGGTEGARWPFVSPDGTWVGFFRDGKIYKVSADGGDVLALCDVRGGPGATWDAHNRIIFSRTWLAGLSTVSADGGTPTVLTTPDAKQHEIGHWWPSMLPDGRVLFTIATASTGLNEARLALLDPARGTYRVLGPGAKPAWLPSGHLMFYRTGRYHAVPFDLSSGQMTGESFPVLDDAQELDPAGDWPQPVAMAPGGTLAYLAGPYVPPSRLTWIDGKGTLTPLAFPPRPFVSVRLAPDGRHAATASMEAGRLLIRLLDLERGTEETPKIDGMNWNPAWLPDGRLSFTSMRKGDFDVYVKDVIGTGSSSGAEQAVLAGPDDTDPVVWTRDGRLVFQGSEPDGAYPLKLFDPGGPSAAAAIRRLTEQHVENGGSLSPDDRWLAYHSAANGRPTIYVRPLTGSGPAEALSRNPGEFPVFLRDGKTLAFVRDRRLVLVPWQDRGGRFETGPERAIAELAAGSGWTYGTPYDAAADGRFLTLVRTEAPPPPRIRVVLGWDREVTRLGTRSATGTSP